MSKSNTPNSGSQSKPKMPKLCDLVPLAALLCGSGEVPKSKTPKSSFDLVPRMEKLAKSECFAPFAYILLYVFAYPVWAKQKCESGCGKCECGEMGNANANRVLPLELEEPDSRIPYDHHHLPCEISVYADGIKLCNCDSRLWASAGRAAPCSWCKGAHAATSPTSRSTQTRKSHCMPSLQLIPLGLHEVACRQHTLAARLLQHDHRPCPGWPASCARRQSASSASRPWSHADLARVLWEHMEDYDGVRRGYVVRNVKGHLFPYEEVVPP